MKNVKKKSVAIVAQKNLGRGRKRKEKAEIEGAPFPRRRKPRASRRGISTSEPCERDRNDPESRLASPNHTTSLSRQRRLSIYRAAVCGREVRRTRLLAADSGREMLVRVRELERLLLTLL